MFTGATFLVTPSVRPATLAAIHNHGGTTVYSISSWDDHRPSSIEMIECAVQPDEPDMEAATSSPSAEAEQPLHKSCSDAGPLSWQRKSAAGQPNFTSYFSPSTVAYLRGRRIPIVYERYIVTVLHACQASSTFSAGASTAAPESGLTLSALAPLFSYNPYCMAGLEFTTSQLPRQIKANVIAAMVFYGATYSPHLTADTSLVVYSRILSRVITGSSHAASATSAAGELNEGKRGGGVSKLEVAQSQGIPCVLPSWVQDCVKFGQRLPFTRDGPALYPPITAAVASARQDDDSPATLAAVPPPPHEPKESVAAAVSTLPSNAAAMTAATPYEEDPMDSWGRENNMEGTVAMTPSDASRLLAALAEVLDPTPATDHVIRGAAQRKLPEFLPSTTEEERVVDSHRRQSSPSPAPHNSDIHNTRTSAEWLVAVPWSRESSRLPNGAIHQGADEPLHESDCGNDGRIGSESSDSTATTATGAAVAPAVGKKATPPAAAARKRGRPPSASKALASPTRGRPRARK